MPGMTLRLGPTDHLLLRMLTVLTGKSANQVIVELVRDEFDRQLPGKRGVLAEADGDEGTAHERLRALFRLPPLAEDASADRALDVALAQADVDAGAIYGDGDRAAA